ncbi:LysM peptidoglycan-binding domain-containing protein [Siminovitchia terrae]|uniref:LysM peptidoglycan-binding domain-containing protein n=1 Tax=Siminovitchia terrae TaxID=1914933 RepID=UPI00163BC283|nr:LysM peptidoglycan-binding domain-containing protein [Siminovitchia terrae]
MTYKIEKRIIPGLPNIPLTAIRFVVGHESGNPNNTGPNSLEAEINFMTRNFRNAFTFHWVGGGGRIVQLAPVGRMQYGAGPKANPYSYAHVELARTRDPETFKKDYAAYIWLLRHLADQAGIPKKLDEGTSATKGIKSHDWIRRNLGGTTHTDPFGYLAQFGVTAAQFKRDVENGIGVAKPADKPAVSKPAANNKPASTTGAHTVKKGDTLSAIAKKDKTTVNELVKINGIKNPNLIKVGQKIRLPGSASKPKGDQKTGSIVDYLKSIGQDSSFTNRKKLASKHGIKNYTGTETQNTQLLKKLRG